MINSYYNPLFNFFTSAIDWFILPSSSNFWYRIVRKVWAIRSKVSPASKKLDTVNLIENPIKSNFYRIQN